MTKINTVHFKQPVELINGDDRQTTHFISRGNKHQFTSTRSSVISLLNGNMLYYVDASPAWFGAVGTGFKMAIELTSDREIVTVRYDTAADIYREKAEEAAAQKTVPPRIKSRIFFRTIEQHIIK